MFEFDLKAFVWFCIGAGGLLITLVRPSGKGKYKEKDISWDNLERVKFTIICEAVLLVLSGKLDKLEDTPDDGIYETLHRRG